MNKLIPFLLATAVVAPLYFSTPAQAQSVNDIQRLEEQVNEAKARGNWGAAQELEVRLNQARLQFQRNNGMGEVNDGHYRYNGQIPNYYPNDNRNAYQYNNRNVNRNNRNNRNNNRDVWRQQQQQQQRGYYDQRGQWHRY